MSEELHEQFIYPTNKILRKAYQAIIYAVVKKRQIRFLAPTLSREIIEYMGWPDDSNSANIDFSGASKPPGNNHKKATNMLRTFEGKFLKFVGTGMALEVFIFKPDGKRVSSYEELEQLCAIDPDMSEVVATNISLNLDQGWNDQYVTQPSIGVTQELAVIDSQIAQKKAEITKAKEKKSARHKGRVKGIDVKVPAYNIPSNEENVFDDLVEVKTPLEMEGI